jgi:uncharacterized protein (DUF1501 family)
MVSLSMLMPKVWLSDAQAQQAPGRRIFVVIQLAGGNDSLNTVIPYTNARYRSLRPTLSFADSELKDDQGKTMLISSQFGLHPALTEIKDLYDQDKVAIVLGVGYPNANLSHFSSMDIWHAADPQLGRRDGWLGRYADQMLAGAEGLTAISIGGGSLPKSLLAERVVIPNVTNFTAYDFLTDTRYAGDRANRLEAFTLNHSRSFPDGPFVGEIRDIGLDAVRGAQQLKASIGTYNSPVTYPAGNPLASALRMAAQVATTIEGTVLFYVQMGGFDNHSGQIGVENGQPSKLAGDHSRLLNFFSEAVKAFYEDMAAHGLADKVVMMEWSEFARRPAQNNSLGTDHGTAGALFVIGDPVSGGLYGEHPSLEATDLDRAGNMRFTVDFRSVYGTIIDRWLGGDSRAILGSQFENVGFLG